MSRILPVLLLLASTLAAAPIYRITLEGVVLSGSASTLDHPAQADLTGLAISLVIDYDLSLMPAPTIENPPSGLASGFGTSFASSLDPIWITRQTVTISSFPALGSGFDSPFEFPVVPVPPTGTPNNPSTRDQQLSFTASTVSAILGSAQFLDDWSDGALIRRRGSQVSFLLNSSSAFLQPAPGLQPFAVTADFSGGGVFDFNDFEWTTTNSFFTTNNDIRLRFEVTSGQGEFVPEPATGLLAGAALAVVAAWRRRRV